MPGMRPEHAMSEAADSPSRQPPLIAVAGWKNSGKTTLVVKLVTEFTRRGKRVATLKHAHHDLRLDDEDTDSARHRRAGARQVAVVSSRRWAVMTETPDEAELTFRDAVAMLGAADLIVVEGYKSQPIPKIEVRRKDGRTGHPLADIDANVVAIAADFPVDGGSLPVFDLNDVTGIADFVAERFDL